LGQVGQTLSGVIKHRPAGAYCAAQGFRAVSRLG